MLLHSFYREVSIYIVLSPLNLWHLLTSIFGETSQTRIHCGVPKQCCRRNCSIFAFCTLSFFAPFILSHYYFFLSLLHFRFYFFCTFSCLSQFLSLSSLLLLDRVAQIVGSWHPGCEKMEQERGNGERITLYIYTFSLHFFPLSPFPSSKSVSFCYKMLNSALLSRMSQKS